MAEEPRRGHANYGAALVGVGVVGVTGGIAALGQQCTRPIGVISTVGGIGSLVGGFVVAHGSEAPWWQPLASGWGGAIIAGGLLTAVTLAVCPPTFTFGFKTAEAALVSEPVMSVPAYYDAPELMTASEMSAVGIL